MKQEHLFWLMSLALVAVAVLVGLGKVPATNLEVVVAGLLGWMAPSPVVRDISK
jgi:hypothetical protein